MPENLPLTDPLTGLPNRRAIDRLAEREISRRVHLSRPLALGLIDVDCFKMINARYTLSAGDKVLVDLAKVLLSSLRPGDLIGRIGGDEFLVIAPETNMEGAEVLGERIRSTVERAVFSYEDEIIPVRVSLGFAVAEAGVPAEYEHMRHVAGAALVQAQITGRDRVVIKEGFSLAEPLGLLLIEHDESFSKVISNSLESAGHRVIVCGTTADALMFLSQSRFDLVITCDRFPDMLTGCELLQILRRKGINTPAIMLSGCCDDWAAEAHRVGFLDYVVRDPGLTFLAELPRRVSEAVARFRLSAPHSQMIRLRGTNGDVEGVIWQSESMLRVGRLANLEVVLDDASISGRHTEIRLTRNGWRIRDLGSTNGTFLNGSRLGPGEWPIRAHDILRFGNVTAVVDKLREGSDDWCGNFLVSATTSTSYEDAKGLASEMLHHFGHHLIHPKNEEDLKTILNDARSTLGAQHGAIVLADDKGVLQLRALALGHSQAPSRPAFSASLAERSFTRGESILCWRVEEHPARTILCVLLRTTRKRLGVLYLVRDTIQQPFTQDDLHLAEVLAANVSAGIESAQLDGSGQKGNVQDAAAASVCPEPTEGLARRIRELEQANQWLKDKNKTLERLVLTDPLTGLYNREGFRQCLIEEYERAKSLHLPLSIIALDLDRFREVNKHHTLSGGDRVLVEVARLVSFVARPGDLVVRDGGDQFTLILPGTGGEEAFREAERIRLAIASATLEVPVTVCAGVATLTSGEIEGWELFERARRAVHQAKDSGRNRVAMVDPMANGHERRTGDQ